MAPQEDALLINLGDLLARWTGDRWMSTIHRVVAPIDPLGKPYRRPACRIFPDGNADAVVSTLPGGRTSADAYEPVTIAGHLAAKPDGSRGLRPNAGAQKEARRLPRRTHMFGNRVVTDG